MPGESQEGNIKIKQFIFPMKFKSISEDVVWTVYFKLNGRATLNSYDVKKDTPEFFITEENLKNRKILNTLGKNKI